MKLHRQSKKWPRERELSMSMQFPPHRVEPVSATLVKEEQQVPTMVDMDIDSHDSAQGHKTVDADNLQQPARDEIAHRKNGDTNKWIESREGFTQ
jgi:hypothetical protein